MKHVLVLLFLLPVVSGCSETSPRAVLYCAQDREHAGRALQMFESRHQVQVSPKFDTEADKSVSLYVELVQEKSRPRCDVFWNNEILSTIRLQKQGLLLPYVSPSAKEYPAFARASDDTWHAFAARARILIVNPDKVPPGEAPQSLLDLTNERWRRKVLMAKPHHGTSATQAACLFEVLGDECAKQFYRDLHSNEVQLVPGNRQVAEWVAEGQTPSGAPAWIGITDTDDAMGVLQKGGNVVLIFPDAQNELPRMGVLIIPNTVSILQGCPHPAEAKMLIDFLLSPEMEKTLAEGASHQIPLNPKVKVSLPEAFAGLKDARRMEVDFEKAAAKWDEVQTFLRNEFSGG